VPAPSIPQRKPIAIEVHLTGDTDRAAAKQQVLTGDLRCQNRDTNLGARALTLSGALHGGPWTSLQHPFHGSHT